MPKYGCKILDRPNAYIIVFFRDRKLKKDKDYKSI